MSDIYYYYIYIFKAFISPGKPHWDYKNSRALAQDIKFKLNFDSRAFIT